ncbi:unnamed protein product [Protopolystoma xenopodis]|uniref:Uncharacterized protein n=1 Tax=Protopolystoma xenopodis TaxID=117903 RepID=A0A3S4ZLP7_9PLAT|nr:unnamed protein product [Protopolystoma xenopodis]
MLPSEIGKCFENDAPDSSGHSKNFQYKSPPTKDKLTVTPPEAHKIGRFTKKQDNDISSGIRQQTRLPVIPMSSMHLHFELYRSPQAYMHTHIHTHTHNAAHPQQPILVDVGLNRGMSATSQADRLRCPGLHGTPATRRVMPRRQQGAKMMTHIAQLPTLPGSASHLSTSGQAVCSKREEKEVM